MAYRRIALLKTTEQFRDYLQGLGLSIEIDDDPLSAAENSPLAQPIKVGDFQVGNRWAVHPMEGWDATRDGKASEETLRRWQHFGESGCKLIWGGEAVAVCPAGRANPNQLYYHPENEKSLSDLLQTLNKAHTDIFGSEALDDFLVGLQLTHSGRFSRPNEKVRLESRVAYHHPILDERVKLSDQQGTTYLTDEDIQELIQQYVDAARAAEKIGYRFVDIKHCHGYLGHEFLSAFSREGNYGGSFETRARFLKEICQAVKAACPNLMLGVRLSLFDFLPFQPESYDEKTGRPGIGQPAPYENGSYPGFGCDRSNPLTMDLTEPIRLLEMMRDELGVVMVNLTAGSPYYNPHIQRPAYFPPSDGYQPPEDPLVGCVRQIEAVARLKKAVPDLPIVGPAYSYFQEYLPHVAQAVVRRGDVDFVGIGRLVLSQWQMPTQILNGEDYRATKKICRTFSDCTTGPRNGLISGCYPLDDYYKSRPEFQELKAIKAGKKPE